MKLFYLIILLISFSTLQAQKTLNENALTEESLSNQFEYVISKSRKYQKYKVVDKTWLNLLKQNTIDSINTFKSEYNTIKLTATNQQKTISELKQQISETNQILKKITNEKNSIGFFGAIINKSTYKIVIWSICILLIILIILAVHRYKNVAVITTQTKESYEALSLEFETFRTRALEREQKVRRQLQDEINKQKEIK